MSTEKLFTVFLTFSDHTVGIGQCATELPEEALKDFIQTSESLANYDRSLLLKSVLPLTHIAKEKGIWLFTFDPYLTEFEWPGNNAVLGGYIVQTDNTASARGVDA